MDRGCPPAGKSPTLALHGSGGGDGRGGGSGSSVVGRVGGRGGREAGGGLQVGMCIQRSLAVLAGAMSQSQWGTLCLTESLEVSCTLTRCTPPHPL